MEPNISTQAPVDPSQPVTPVKPEKPKAFLWVALGILVVFLIGGAYYLGTHNVQHFPLPLASPVSYPSTNSIANWKTFTSSKGYEIKYPPDLGIPEWPPEEVEKIEGFYSFRPINPSKPIGYASAFSIDERGEKTILERKTSLNLIESVISEIQLPGVNGFIVEGTVPGIGIYHKSVYIDLNGRELIIGCGKLVDEYCKSGIFDQILSTFKFFGNEPASVDTTPPTFSGGISGVTEGGIISFDPNLPGPFCMKIIATDNVTGRSKIQFRNALNAEEWSSWSVNSERCWDFLESGDYSYNIQAKDEAGNLSEVRVRVFQVE